MDDVPDNINVIEPFLKELYGEYASPRIDPSHNNDWNLVKDTLVDYLKKADRVFTDLFKKLSYQGSTYENLKIGPRNEYDINLELRLLDYYELEVNVEGTNPGFAIVKVGSVKRKQPSKEVMENVEKWLDEERYLCTNKILNWFKGVVDNAIKAMKETEAIHEIQICRRESGPAITLYINYLREFSVDLVLALPFATDKMPDKQRMILQKAIENMDQSTSVYVENQVWYLIPKKPSVLKFNEWRMSFYLYEKRIMNGLYGMKFVIKILKALRDRRKWKPLSSYYIKTVFLWELEANEPGFWSDQSLSYLFYHMLNRLVVYLDIKSIEYFWDENCNLVKALNEDFLTNMKWFIFNHIEDLDKALRGQRSCPRDVLEKMFSHERVLEPECISGQMNTNEQKGIGSFLFDSLSNAFSDFLLSEPSGNEAAGPSQSAGLVNFLGGIAKQFENCVTPWKREGIEENEGLVEGLDNGYSEPTSEHARKRQGFSLSKWLLLGAALAVGVAAAMRYTTTTTTTTTTTSTNSTTTTSNTTSSIRRFQS